MATSYKCKYCGNEFVKKPHTGTQKFCSKECRSDFFHRLHPEKKNEYNKKYRLRKKQQKKCIICGKDIPKISKRFRYCSDSCARESLNKSARTKNSSIRDGFVAYKESLGCSLCGYNECGASLVYHHIYRKDRRITGALWFYKTVLFEKEMKKCVLLCSNCHKMLHFIFDDLNPTTYESFIKSVRPYVLINTEYFRKYFEIVQEKKKENGDVL